MPLPNIGPGELIIILVIALLLLGPGRLPDVAQSLGKSVREFRRAVSDVTDDVRTEPRKTDAPAQPALVAPPPPPAVPAQPESPAPVASAGGAEPAAVGSATTPAEGGTSVADRDSSAA